MDLALGNYLQQLRQGRGVALATLARSAQISRSTLHNWEAHRTLPRIQELEALLNALAASRSERLKAISLLKAPRAQKRLQDLAPEDSVLPLPHAGDLLRLVRTRQGWTQARFGQEFEVSQSTVARWERGEIWPERELIEGICRRLEVPREERHALSVGPVLLAGAGSGEAKLTSLDVLEAQRAAVTRLLLDPKHYSLGDLYYLYLEAQAAALARKYGAGRILLARVLLDQAAYLADRWQLTEAGRIAERVLELLPQSDARWNDLHLTAEFYWVVWKYPIREHVQLLKHWLDLPLPLGSQSWVMSQIANSLLANGQIDTALALHKKIVRLVTDRGTPKEIQHHRNVYAENLLAVGRAGEAVELFSAHEGIRPPNRLRMNCNLIEAYLTLGKRSQAHDLLQQVHTDKDYSCIPHYVPIVGALERQV